MRKILLIIILILVIAFGYFSLTKGIKIGNLQISSIMQIDEKSKELEQKTEQLNSLIDIQYPKSFQELKNTSKKMKDAKEEYLRITNSSTEEEIQNALQIESYDIERLYVKLGLHARKEGVTLKFVLNPSSSGTSNTKDIAFTVDGSYIAITNFIYAIEDDTELKFRIYDFKLVPYQNEILRGSFNVKNVRITSNSLNENLTTKTQTNNEENNNKQ